MARFSLLACLLLSTFPSPLPAEPLHLLPAPREVQPGTALPLPQGLRITCTSCFTDTDDNFTVQNLTQTLATRGISTTGPVTVQLSRVQTLPDEMKPEGYTITPNGNTLTLAASSSTGLFYAAQTLKQLIQHDGAAAVLHMATIRDWPAMRYRGVQDDLSRGPVPTLDFQKHFIRTLAAYKVNLYSPYFEHTQQYVSNPLMAPPGGSLSAADAREIAAYAARFHVTVAPEQEAFGHLHNALTWEQYTPLSETLHGTALAPGQPGALPFIQQMFTELADLYPGPFLHIGADETVDLGKGLTKPDVDARGLGPVYLDFVQKIAATLAPLHRRLLFWGDIAQEVTQTSPDLLRNLPAAFKKATIAVAWWYSPNPGRGFAPFLTPFTSAGFETWVAPGISNWSSVWPNSNDALVNIQQFVAEGQRQHSTGMLNTVWYDDGEALANSNWYGLLFGAAAGWHTGQSSIEDFQSSFGEVFHGDSTGAIDEAQRELMSCHAILRNQAKVGDGSDGLFWQDPWSREGQINAPKIRPVLHDLRMHAEHALILIAQARAAYPAAVGTVAAPLDPAHAFPSNPTSLHETDALDAMELGARRLDFIGLKFQLADEIVSGYARAIVASTSTDKKTHATTGPELSDIHGINGRIRDLRDGYALLRGLYQQAWLRSNRPYALEPVLAHYDLTIQLWQARNDRFKSANKQYDATKALPSPADVGLPAR